ncbi:MAG: hypothetical protein U0401_27290 [Anaerolineae bacterium]
MPCSLSWPPGWAWLCCWAVNIRSKYDKLLPSAPSSGESPFRPDRSSLTILEQGLTNPQAGGVLYTLDLLAEVAPRQAACRPASFTGTSRSRGARGAAAHRTIGSNLYPARR